MAYVNADDFDELRKQIRRMQRDIDARIDKVESMVGRKITANPPGQQPEKQAVLRLLQALATTPLAESEADDLAVEWGRKAKRAAYERHSEMGAG